MSGEANKQLARRHYEDIVNLNNLGAAEEQMAEDFIDHGAKPGHASRGPEATRQAMAALRAVVPDVHITLDEVIAARDVVAVHAIGFGPASHQSSKTHHP